MPETGYGIVLALNSSGERDRKVGGRARPHQHALARQAGEPRRGGARCPVQRRESEAMRLALAGTAGSAGAGVGSGTTVEELFRAGPALTLIGRPVRERAGV